MSNRMSGEDGAEMVFRSVASLLGHKVRLTFGCRSVLCASPEQSLWLGSQSNFEVGSSSIQTHPNSFLPTCEAVPTSSCRPHELQSYRAHLRDILRSYRIERKTEETHTESAVGDSDRGEVVPATTLDTIVGDEDCSPKEVRENVFSSMCVRGEMAVERKEESLKLTSSTFGEEEGYCQTSSAKGGEVMSAVGANGLERYGGFAGPADDTAVDELLDSLSILFTASASFDSEKSSCHASLSLEFGGVCCESLESSSSQPRSQESSLPTCLGVPTSSCHPHELQSYLPHLRDILRSYRIERKTEETHTESTVKGSDRGEDLPATTFDTTLGDENDCTMGDVVMTMQTPERNEEMESLRQALKESEEKCLTLLEEKGSVEKKCAESEEKLANLRTEKSAREEEVQKLTEKNTSLEEEGSRLRKESDDLAGKLSSMERERSAREEEVQKLTEKNTSLEEEGSRLKKERDDLAGKLSSMERELEEKCLQLLEEKRSAEKKWAEMEGQLASLRTERSAREEEVQKLTEKNTSLEKESSRLRKESDDLAGRLSTMERERSAREEEVQKLTEKNTSLEEEGSRLRKESDDLAGRLSSMERELKEKCLQLLEEKRSAEKKWAEMEGQLASLRTERGAREEEVQKLTKKNTSLEEEGSRLRKESDDLAGRLSTMEREVQKLTEKNTSLEEDRSTMKRKMDDQARSLSTMESERVILEKDYCALKREKSNEVNYVKQKLAAEKESNRVLLKRISSMDEKVAKTFNS